MKRSVPTQSGAAFNPERQIMTPKNPITRKEDHNYVAFFLTLTCTLHCPYCINLHALNERSAQRGRSHMSADDWIAAANRLILCDDLPLTLQGGEPTLHRDFYRIVNEVKPEVKMDLMTQPDLRRRRLYRERPLLPVHP